MARLSAIALALLRAVARAALHLLAPAACAACDAPVVTTAVFCSSCAHSVLRDGAPPAVSEGQDVRVMPVVAFASFGGAMAVALRRFKFGGRSDLARPLRDLLRCALRDARLSADLVVPVPLHPKRLAERGYNQAALLARGAAAELSAPLVARALSRTTSTHAQARLDREARQINVAGAFRVRDAATVRGRRVLLVDDVATTGATLRACADALLAAGACAVIPLVLARADRRHVDEEPTSATRVRDPTSGLFEADR